MNGLGIRLSCFFFILIGAMLFSVRPSAAQDAAGIYKSKCAACHGADGKGNTGAGKALGAHDFSSPEIQKMSDEDLTQIISDGKGKMPAYGKTLSAADIKGLVDYIRGLAKK